MRQVTTVELTAEANPEHDRYNRRPQRDLWLISHLVYEQIIMERRSVCLAWLNKTGDREEVWAGATRQGLATTPGAKVADRNGIRMSQGDYVDRQGCGSIRLYLVVGSDKVSLEHKDVDRSSSQRADSSLYHRRDS